MDQATIIRKPDGGGIAILHLREMNSPSWAHVRADYWIPANDLSLIGRDTKTHGRFFTDRCVVSGDGGFLLIEEMEFDGTQDSVDLHSSRLLLIDTRSATETEVGRIDNGSCLPKRIDGERLIYSKMRTTETGIQHDFEREISSLAPWTRLGEQVVGGNLPDASQLISQSPSNHTVPPL